MSAFPHPRRRSVMSVGRALPGMMDLSRNASSNIRPTEKTLKLLAEASEECGCVKVEVKDEALAGKKMFRINVADRPWQEKLDTLGAKVDDITPCVFVLYRKRNDVLLIKYIPDKSLTKTRMLYASSMSSLKQAVVDVTPDVRIEEYNVSEVDELSQDEYFKQKNVEAPLSEAEIQRREQDAAETGGAYSLLARLTGRSPVALPGMASAGPMPTFLARGQVDKNEEEADEAPTDTITEEPAEPQGESASEEDIENSGAAQSEPRESDEPSPKSRKSSSRKSTSRKSSSRKASSDKSSSRKPEPAVVVEEVDPDQEEAGMYPYTCADLAKMHKLGEYDEGMDKTALENYLSAKEFKKAFGMARQEFDALPQWRRQNMKRKLNIF